MQLVSQRCNKTGRQVARKIPSRNNAFGFKHLQLDLVCFCRCGVALDVWMSSLGEEIFKYDIDQPLLFVNSQALHRWKENVEPLKKLINKKSG